MYDAYLTANEVADILRLNVETVYRLIADDKLPATKVGRSWRFEREAVQAWFRERSLSQTRASKAKSTAVVASEND